MSSLAWSSVVQTPEAMFAHRAMRFRLANDCAFKRLFSLPDSGRLVDVGCGSGGCCMALRRLYPNANIVGVDNDSSHLMFARKHVPNVTFECRDFRCWAPRVSFDGALAFSMFGFVPAEPLFACLAKIVQYGGSVSLVSVVNRTETGFNPAELATPKTGRFLKRLDASIEHLSPVTRGRSDPNYAISLAARNGLRLIAVRQERFAFSEFDTDYASVVLPALIAIRKSRLDTAWRSARCRAKTQYLLCLREIAGARAYRNPLVSKKWKMTETIQSIVFSRLDQIQ